MKNRIKICFIASILLLATVVFAAEPPVAVIKVFRTTGQAPYTVLFNAYDSTGDIVRYEWDFHDENQQYARYDTGRMAGHRFDNPGPYDVTLTVYDSTGLSNTTSVPITVVNYPLNAKTYYVANDGNDTNDGLSESTPWRTIRKVQQEINLISDGSRILFRRGDSFSHDYTHLDAGMGNDLNFGDGDFTIDFWFNFPTASDRAPQSGYVFSTSSAIDQIAIYYDAQKNAIISRIAGSPDTTILSSVPKNIWAHMAIVKSRGTLQFFINGLLSLAIPNTNTFDTPNNVIVGDGPTSGSCAWVKIDELRVKNIAVWEGDFTPPTVAYASDINTKLLLHFDNINSAGNFVDSSGLQHVSTNYGAYIQNGKFSFCGDFEGQNTWYLYASKYGYDGSFDGTFFRTTPHYITIGSYGSNSSKPIVNGSIATGEPPSDGKGIIIQDLTINGAISLRPKYPFAHPGLHSTLRNVDAAHIGLFASRGVVFENIHINNQKQMIGIGTSGSRDVLQPNGSKLTTLPDLLYINNAEVENSRSHGIYVAGGGTNILVENCNLHHNGIWINPPYNAPLRDGFTTHVSGENIVLRRSDVHHNGYALGWDAASPDINEFELMKNYIIENNKIHDHNLISYSYGLQLSSQQGLIIRNNLFYNNLGQDIKLLEPHNFGGVIHDASSDNVQICNNVFYNTSEPFYISGDQIDTVYIKNNIVYRNAYPVNTNNRNGSSAITAENNFFNGDPLFVDENNFNFNLQSTSPARDSGTAVNAYYDFEGNVRPQGANFDIGAYEYAILQYTITATAQQGGSIMPSGNVKVNHGDTQEFTIAANTGYHIQDLLADGEAQGAISGYIFSNVTGDHTIEARFAINAYTLAVNAINGSVSKNPDKADYNHGEQVTLTATAISGYRFAGWAGDVSDSINPLTITMDSNKIITANFELIPAPPATVPAAPSNLTLSNITKSSIKLTWQDNSNNETGFKVERRYKSGWWRTSWTKWSQVSADVNIYTNSSLKPNTTYIYRVRAYNAQGNSAYSNEVSAKTLR